MLTSEIADLSCLGVDGFMGIVDVAIDQFAVLDVDEWGEEGDGGADEAETPERSKLDEEVGDEGCRECLEKSAVRPAFGVGVGHLQE